MTKPKRKRTKFLHGCPRCGGLWTQVAGIVRCRRCGHERWSQQPAKAEMHPLGSRVAPLIAEEQPRASGDPPGRLDRPINLKERP